MMPETASSDSLLDAANAGASPKARLEPSTRGTCQLSVGPAIQNGSSGPRTPPSGPENGPNPQAAPMTNGQQPEEPTADPGHTGERPAKRRRTRDTASPLGLRKLKPESPPWKQIQAEGPTSYTENGRRKSGRINAIHLELQPESSRRKTRRTLNGSLAGATATDSPSATGKKGRPPSAKAKAKSPRKDRGDSATTAPKQARGKQATEPRNSRHSRRYTEFPQKSQPARYSTRNRRTIQSSDLTDSPDDSLSLSRESSSRPSRSKSRISLSSIIPLVHPDQVRKRQKIGQTFNDFWDRAGDIPVEEGGLLASEDGPLYTEDLARKDARLILRIEAEAEPGGLLSQERCSLFAPEPVEEPPRQWARQDHMVKAMANFRRLLVAEQQRHRSTAKKLAEACLEAWHRRQPKSAEEVEAEEREKWAFRYRLVVRAMYGTWENVRMQVNRQRLEDWEAEEQRRVRAALNEAVSISEQKLQARRGGLDSDAPSDDDASQVSSDAGHDGETSSRTDNDGDESDSEEDSDIMSSSDDDDGDDIVDAADERLTQEQLREKYANIPHLVPAEDHIQSDKDFTPRLSTAEVVANQGSDTSDESIDMDDDLGSSEMGSDADGEDGSDEAGESGSDDEKSNGLLGLMFSKSELKQFKDEASEDASQTQAVDAGFRDQDASWADGESAARDSVLADDDEMLLVRLPDSLGGDSADVSTIARSTTELSERPESTTLSQLETGPSDHTIAKASIEGGGGENDDDVQTFPDVGSSKSVPHGDRLTTASIPTSVDGEASVGHLIPLSTSPGQGQEPDVTIEVTSTEPNGSPMKFETETEPMDMDLESVSQSTAAKVGASRPMSPQTHSGHRTEIPSLLRGTLREYQHDGLDWLADLYANNTNGILADEMGLGKTIQTIALLAHLACRHEVWGPHLVVVPTSVMLNWEMEFKKWCPGFKILAYYGSLDERKRKRQGWNNDDVWNVCITSYQLVLQDQQVFKRRRWHYMILDEAHNIKNFKSQRWQTLLGFNTHSRLLLTGTPLQNNLTELWSLLFFLMPAENGVGGFADLEEFHDWFHKPESQILEMGRDQMDDEAKAIITKLHRVLRPYLLRRLKADVEKQMPAKYEHVEFCRLSKRQRELYDGFLSRTETKEVLASGNYLSIINCLMQLRKVCNHPDLFIDRPIMTSYRMQRSVAAEFETTEQKVRGHLMEKPMSLVNLAFLNLIPTENEGLSRVQAERIFQLSAHRALVDLRESQKRRAQGAFMHLDPFTVKSNLAYFESAARWDRYEELQHCVYVNALRRQQKPIYGTDVLDLVYVEAHKRPWRPRPKIPGKVMAWFENESEFVSRLTPTLAQRADSLKTVIAKFSCVTPAVVTRDLEGIVLGRRGVEAFRDTDLKLSAPVRWAPFIAPERPADPWHEARMRLSIQFPDKRLLQYDCGKLQVLDKLLRKLQAGGHRALIFTQMTKVLDILEQFLNMHGHKYLRLDGATKVEQRQILTDRFNNDGRILCFILSTRSGGLGINLTGADTVIFYDQDWNPAMDKQCQDRCHRIGQTRDVHIYRLVSEHTIEANILRKASQKQMLDDVVIQEGEFTTDYLNRISVRDVLGDKVDLTSEGVTAADAALDLVLGGPEKERDQRTVGRDLEQAEDKEDVAAARVAEREIQADEADFTERTGEVASGATTTRQGTPFGRLALEGGAGEGTSSLAPSEGVEYNVWGGRMGNVDDYMLGFMGEQLKDTKLELPRDKKRGKKRRGKERRKR